MKPKQKDKNEGLAVTTLQVDEMQVYVIGRSPLIMNRMSEKVRQELLLPARRKTAADKRSNLKHVPLEEFRSSIYMSNAPSAKTAVHLPSGAFSKSMAQAALDIPGATKAQVQRLVRVKDLTVDIYGIPQLYMSVVRTMGINKTPDIRTRAIFPTWAATFTVKYVSNLVSQNTIGSLLGAAGFLSGVGDFRGEKGGSFGQFDIANEKDVQEIIKEGGREVQLAAIESPDFYDPESTELFSWFETEVALR